MSIVTDSSKNRVIFCEGNPSSPDIILWSRILIQSRHPNSPMRVELKPMGGKQAAKNFARGYQSATSNENWKIIRDRDLDAETDDGALVQWDKGKTLLTGLICIESYFLQPDLLQQYIAINKIHSSTMPQDHHKSLENALEQLRDYQAVRWALQRVRNKVQEEAQKKSLYRTVNVFDLPNRLAETDGKLPPNLDLASCTETAINLCESFRDNFKQVDSDFLKEAINDFRSDFDGDDFWHKQFKFWFHGKDVLKFWLKDYQINSDDYNQWAARNVDWTQYPDLLEIQSLCQST